jgi:hypothetical protein
VVCFIVSPLPVSLSSPVIMVSAPSHPPCKQGLAAVVVVAGSPPSPQSSSSVHPRSTPRAVAHEAEGRWCASLSVLSLRCRHLLSLSTRDPPCEQGLATVGAGAGSLTVVFVDGRCVHWCHWWCHPHSLIVAVTHPVQQLPRLGRPAIAGFFEHSS